MHRHKQSVPWLSEVTWGGSLVYCGPTGASNWCLLNMIKVVIIIMKVTLIISIIITVIIIITIIITITTTTRTTRTTTITALS